MLQKVNGFTKFMNKIEGKDIPDESDSFCSAGSLSSRLSEGALFLVQLLRAEISWRTYAQGMYRFSPEERQAMQQARTRTPITSTTCSEVGLHQSDWDTYVEAIEYLLSNPACQRQDDYESTVTEEVYRDSATNDLAAIYRDLINHGQ